MLRVILTCLQATDRARQGLPKRIPIPGVKHVILVSSAKGGVGKSATTVNLALTIKKIYNDKSIGILDADVYGPSIPRMMNMEDEQPELNEKNLMIPVVNYGIKCMSMGFLVSKDSAIVWRGLMVMQAIERLLRQVVWGPLDILLIDMPPGTGDTQLSISQNIPVSGAVIVTTPQKISLIDASKAILMYKKVNVSIFGVVQNMSYFKCGQCDKKHELYGSSEATELLCQKMDVNLLAKLPFDPQIMACNDEGSSITSSSIVDPVVMDIYDKLARDVVGQLRDPLD